MTDDGEVVVSFGDACGAAAIFSPCHTYRYQLRRVWDLPRGLAMFIGLNPSTADENVDDPTIRRCARFARSWGYGGIVMTNLYAYRATDPSVLGKVDDPVGPENDHHLQACAAKAAVVVAAWGAFPYGKPYERAVADMFDRDLQCLGTTKGGSPRHPLYVRGDTPLIRWAGPRDTPLIRWPEPGAR